MAEGKFEILLAQTAGFCMGVRRAVRMVLDAAQSPVTALPIRTPGPLIHNRQVLEVLEERDVLVMDEGEDAGGGTAVIRAHGLSRQEQDDLARRFGRVLDATCPHVRRVQQIVEEYAARGYLCIVVGDRGHAEVEAVLSYAAGAGRVVAGPEEVQGLPDAEKAVVVAQTTQNEELFRAVVREAEQKYAECLSFETICRSTSRRQAEARALTQKVNAMIVVGGYNSANTRRLAEISAAAGTPTYHVETEEELDVDRILSYGRVGLTAGASTPNWMIRRVMLRLIEEHRRRSGRLRHMVRSALAGLVFTNLCAAGGLAALTFASAHLLTERPARLPLCMAISFTFMLGQQILNQYVRRGSLYLSEPARSNFFMRNNGALLALGLAASCLSIILSFLLGPLVLSLVALGSITGFVYQLRFPRPLALRLGVRSLEQLPASKDAFVGLAWGALAGVVPALVSAGATLRGALVAAALCFLMGFQRTLALDIRDLWADRLLGRETLVRILGGTGASVLFVVLVAFQALTLVSAGMSERLTPLAFPMLVGPVYALLCFSLLRKSQLDEDVSDALVEGQFYLIGAVALLWMS